MAFPVSPVLDDFNTGASQALSIRPGWSTDHSNFGDLTTDVVPTKAVVATNGDNFWATSFTNPEAYTTIIDWPGVSDSYRVVARWSGVATKNFYAMFIYSTGWNLQRFDANTATVNIASGGLTPAAGDSLGISCIGSTISGYYKSGAGSWSLLGSGTDATYASGGIGVLSNNNGGSIDYFAGGEAVPLPVAAPRQQSVPFTRGAGGGGKI